MNTNSWTISAKRLFIKQVDDGWSAVEQCAFWGIGKKSVYANRKNFRAWIDKVDLRVSRSKAIIHMLGESIHGDKKHGEISNG